MNGNVLWGNQRVALFVFNSYYYIPILYEKYVICICTYNKKEKKSLYSFSFVYSGIIVCSLHTANYPPPLRQQSLTSPPPPNLPTPPAPPILTSSPLGGPVLGLWFCIYLSRRNAALDSQPQQKQQLLKKHVWETVFRLGRRWQSVKTMSNKPGLRKQNYFLNKIGLKTFNFFFKIQLEDLWWEIKKIHNFIKKIIHRKNENGKRIAFFLLLGLKIIRFCWFAGRHNWRKGRLGGQQKSIWKEGTLGGPKMFVWREAPLGGSDLRGEQNIPTHLRCLYYKFI